MFARAWHGAFGIDTIQPISLGFFPPVSSPTLNSYYSPK